MSNNEFTPPTIMPISRVQQILKITKEDELITELGKFEDAIYSAGAPLIKLLSQDVRQSEVSNLLDHLTSVEKWRDRVCRWHSLARCFEEHTKSDHFTIRRTDGCKITEFDRLSYQKKLSAGFIGLEVYLEQMIRSIDSRTNLCKKLAGLDETAF